MNKPNLYWSVYKNLEKEFLSLADYIHVSDDQLGVYSMHIANLIIRCAVEIESLSKELYYSIGGDLSPVDEFGNRRDLFFDTDCIELLEQQWHICKKEISVSALNLYLTEEKNRILVPLYNANKRGKCKWKQAYQALKHNRRESLKKASIENLLHAMGALFILNLYNKEERTDIGRVYLRDHDFDSRVGSEIFSVHFCRATCIRMKTSMDDSCICPPIDQNELERSVYIIKYDDKSFKEMNEKYCEDKKITLKRFNSSPEIVRFLVEHPEYENKTINEICMAAGGAALLGKIVCSHSWSSGSERTEALLNKHNEIYPHVSHMDVSDS